MPTRVLALIPILLFATYTPGRAQFQTSKVELSPKPQATPSSTPIAWPNLDRLKNPNGSTCSLDGASGGSREKAAQNRLRNRYHLPDQGFEELTLEDLQKNLPQGEIAPEPKLVKFPASDDPNNQRAVTVVGYVTEVLILGCGAANEIVSFVPPRKRRGVESANCYVNEERFCTTQVIVSPDPSLPRDQGRNIFVVDVTRRSRRLVNENRLASNIGNDWSTETLRKKIMNRWVRFSGWLFFNQNYRERAWISDPANKIGKANDRQTAWEIHPVMGIEVDVPPPH